MLKPSGVMPPNNVMSEKEGKNKQTKGSAVEGQGRVSGCVMHRS